jgi:REP element-mobilizing transposase RayT
MAGLTQSPWLDDRALCHYARSCAFLLFSRVGWQEAANLHAGMEAVEIVRELKFSGKVWQEEFFDHVLRSSESYSQKWDYVKENPVRAGLVRRPDEWPWQGGVESLML